ncbi:hypothetical protein [Scytonema hofmannii]|nr:hypothetical protein [Scytonema hofmannii]
MKHNVSGYWLVGAQGIAPVQWLAMPCARTVFSGRSIGLCTATTVIH